jgi:uncharacterized heparinase superfamily protein
MPSQWLKNLGHKASHVKLLRPLYDAQLGRRDRHLAFSSFPQEIISGDAGHGRWVASGQIDVNGKRFPIDTDHWFIGHNLQDTPFFEKLHDFSWLSELKALGGITGRTTARKITWAWLNVFDQYHYLTWNPSLTARRLVNWLKAYPFAFEQADDVFLDVFHNQFYRQCRHLVLTLESGDYESLDGRFDTLWALCIIGGHCPELADGREESWLHLLKGALEDVVHNDGGAMSSCPQKTLHITRQLITLRQSLQQTHKTLPLWLSKTIEVMVRFLNTISHTDKNLPCFGQSIESGKHDIEKITRLMGLRVRRHDLTAPDTGYSVMRKGKTSVVINHADNFIAPSAFEMGFGPHRIMVSCGTHFLDQAWRDSLHSVHAFSSVSVNNKGAEGSTIKTTIETLNGACLWSGTCEGYDDHVTHTRRLYLDPDGHDFRGEDIFIRRVATQAARITARFHLHPQVKASLINEKKSVLMQLPSGAGWVFDASDAYIMTEESVYLGIDGMSPRKTMQIVLQAEMTSVNHQVKWAVKRV